MANLKKLWQGILFGALAGAAVSMFDKQTRTSIVDGSKNCCDKINTIIKDPESFMETMKYSTNQMRSTIQQISEDITSIVEKVDELRSVPSQVSEVVKETKTTIGDISKLKDALPDE